MLCRAPSSGRVEEAWAALWSVGWVTVQQQWNCGWWGKGTTPADRLRETQSKCYDASANTTPRLRVYVRGRLIPVSIETRVREGGGMAKKTPTCFSLTRTTGKAYIHKMSNLNSIKSKVSPFIYVWLQILKQRKIKSQSYKNGIKNVHNLFISLKIVELWKQLHTPTLVA